MNKTSQDPATTLTLTRRIPAGREDVFAAWTDPEIFKRWWAPPGTTMNSLELDPRVGGTFVEIERPSRIVYTWAWEEDDGPGHESLVTIEFRENGRETDVTLTHERLASEQSRDNHRHGWTGILDNLAAMFGGKGA